MRIPFLSALVPSDAVLFYPLDQHLFSDGSTIDDGDEVETVENEQSGFDLAHLGNGAIWQELNTEQKYIYFDGTKDPLGANGASTLYHIFIIASYEDSAFPSGANGYKGLVSQTTAASAPNGILAGDPGTTKFFDFGYTSAEYRKSGTLYAAGNQQAPVSNVPELIEYKVPGGIAITSIQIGRDRDFAARLWKGKFLGMVALPRAATSLEITKLRLWANLQGRLWVALGQTLSFPAPQIIFDGVNGAYSETYSRFYAPPFDYAEVTDSHTYDDGSKTFNTTSNQPPRRWQVEFNRISGAKAQVLDAFYENVGLNKTFNFYDYRRDKTYSGVRVESYNREHEGHLSMFNNVRFNLVKW